MELKEEMERRPDITQEDLAAERGVTRTRICQYLRLLDLPSDVVEFVRDPRNSQATSNVTESALRELLRIDSEVEVRRRFFEMVGDHAVAGVG